MFPRENFTSWRGSRSNTRSCTTCGMRMFRLGGDVHPVLEVVGPVLRVDRANLSLVQKRQRAAHRRDLHGLEHSVQHQDVTVEHGLPAIPLNSRDAVHCFHAWVLLRLVTAM